MYGNLSRPFLAFLLAWLLACPPLPAQSPQSASADDPHAMVKPDPKRAKKLVELGTKEEQAGANEAALAAYDEAVRYAPFDVTIVAKAAALRSKLIHAYVDSAEKLAVDGNLPGATQQLAIALHIDPSNDVLLERLKELQTMRDEEKGLPPEEPPEGIPQLKPAKTRKDFHLQTTLQGAYEQVAGAYGIKVIFDPDLPARNVKLGLQDADFGTAMKILTLETGTFWKVMNSNRIFVAADTTEKRREFDTVIEQTFVLADSATPTDMTELVKAIRDLTGAQRVQQSLSTHSITVRDTVPRVRLASAIIKDLEKAPGEVLLEFEFLEVDRNKATQLGITPPASATIYYLDPPLLAQLKAATSVSALLGILASVFGTSSVTTLPNVAGFGGGKSTFLISLPTVSGQISESLSLVHSGRQVLMRAEDAKPATFFVGQRYPITLSLLSASLGSATPTANVGGSTTTIPAEQFTVGKGPVSMANADFRNMGVQDLAVLNQVDDTITILLNQGAGASSQFIQASGSPISLNSGSTASAVVSPSVSLTVTSATLQSIAVPAPTATIARGGTQQFSAIGTFSDGTNQDITSNVTWASSNTATATISPQSGVAVGQGSGTTQITATLGGVVSPAVTLTGTTATLRSLAITPGTSSIAKGGTLQYTAIGAFSDGTQQNVTSSVTWSTTNFNVATIGTASGAARGIAVGSAQIQAILNSLTSNAVALKVTAATLKSISVTPATATIAVGTSQHFTATGTYSDGSAQDITSTSVWASSSTATATIAGGSGIATGVAAGTATITATQGGAGTPVSIAAGTFNSNNNSYPDLAVASQTTNTLNILLGNGDGTFSNFQSYVTGNRPSAVAVAPFNTNNNSNNGIVVTNFADNSFSVFLGNGDGTFAQVRGSPFPLPTGQTGPIAVTVSDFNQDGIPDLAILNQTSNNVTILQGIGDGTFKLVSNNPLATGNFPVDISSGTLAGSTGPALAIANQNDNTISVYFGNGNGTFFAASQSPLAAGSTPTGIAIADFGNTSFGGIGVTNQSAGTVTGFADQGNGTFVTALVEPAGKDPGAILVGDFTGNTYPDVIVANNISGSDGQVTLLVSPASLVVGASNGETPYPGSEYVDIGLKIKATPFVHADNEVTLQLEYELKALSGNNNNGIPIISNESVTQTIRLKEGETSIVSGLVDRQLTKTITGIPGLANIPYAGYFFGAHTDSFTNNELLILITPRKLRIPSHELHAIYAGRGDTSGRSGSAGPVEPAAPPTARPEEPPPRNPATPAPVAPAPPAQQPPNTPAPEPQPNPPNPQ
jgi:Bacterial type II and III secretion system protein/Bacterial Ig-like domain (group 2)/FG-GAP-like repeat